MKSLLKLNFALFILVICGCTKKVDLSDYAKGQLDGREEVNLNHQKDGWWGEVKMDVKDELNYVPSDATRSPEFNEGKVDGYLERRSEVDSGQRQLESGRLNKLLDGL